MLLFGITVVVEASRKAWLGVVPAADWMGAVGLLALTTNAVCFALIYCHRSYDLNMRSSWLCSRNDLIANTSVLVAALVTIPRQSRGLYVCEPLKAA